MSTSDDSISDEEVELQLCLCRFFLLNGVALLLVTMGAIGPTLLFVTVGAVDDQLVLAVVETTKGVSKICHVDFFFILHCLLEVCGFP